MLKTSYWTVFVRDTPMECQIPHPVLVMKHQWSKKKKKDVHSLSFELFYYSYFAFLALITANRSSLCTQMGKHCIFKDTMDVFKNLIVLICKPKRFYSGIWVTCWNNTKVKWKLEDQLQHVIFEANGHDNLTFHIFFVTQKHMLLNSCSLPRCTLTFWKC